MNENQRDLANQREVAEVVTAWLQGLPFVGGNGTGFKLTERPTQPHVVDHDYDAWWCHLQVGVLEVKCRKYQLSFFEKHPPTISADKLNHLVEQQRRGFKAAIVFSTTDGAIRIIALDKILKNRDMLTEAGEEIQRSSDHGQGSRAPQKHYNIPLDMWDVIV